MKNVPIWNLKNNIEKNMYFLCILNSCFKKRFRIRIENKEELLRAKLWNHFKQVARREEFYEMIDEAKQNKDFE